MISLELMAAVAQCDEADALMVLTRLQERIGRDALREAFFNLVLPVGLAEEARPQLLQVGAFLRSVGPPPPMLVEGLIPEKALVLLTGKPKFGKSLLALDVAHALARGEPVFGHFPVRTYEGREKSGGPVIYCGMEDGQIEIANRLLKRGITFDDTTPFFVCPQRFTVSTSEGMDTLHAFFKQVADSVGQEPVLVIIDTARESLGIKEWNDAAEVGEKIRPLREGFARERCSVILVGHNRKQEADASGDEISGSNATASSVDGWWSDRRVDKLPSGDRRHYLTVVGRSNMQGDICVEMDTHTLRFRRVPQEEMEAEETQRALQRRASKYDRLLAAFQARPDQKATVGMIAEDLGQEYDTTRFQVQAAEKEGLIESTGETLPTEGRGRRAPLYRLATQLELPKYRKDSIGNTRYFDNSPLSSAVPEAAPGAASTPAPPEAF